MNIQGFARRILLASSFVVFLFGASTVFGGAVQLPTLTYGYVDSSYVYHLVDPINASQAGVYTQNADGTTEWSSGSYTKNPDGSYNWTSPGYSLAGFGSMHWDLTLDADPQVSGFVGLVNNSNFTNTFTVSVSQPVAPIAPGTAIMSGSTAWTVSDSANDGATLNAPASVPSALYNAIVDGNLISPVRQLYPTSVAPLPLVAPNGGTNSTVTASFSNEPVLGAINSSIGIFNYFTLSPGDLASATSVFRVDIVAPEPASLTLSILGLLGLPVVYRLRRR